VTGRLCSSATSLPTRFPRLPRRAGLSSGRTGPGTGRLPSETRSMVGSWCPHTGLMMASWCDLVAVTVPPWSEPPCRLTETRRHEETKNARRVFLPRSSFVFLFVTFVPSCLPSRNRRNASNGLRTPSLGLSAPSNPPCSPVTTPLLGVSRCATSCSQDQVASSLTEFHLVNECRKARVWRFSQCETSARIHRGSRTPAIQLPKTRRAASDDARPLPIGARRCANRSE
jgi:hypothetical protein